MSSTFTCPHCGMVSEIDPAHVGRSGPCRGCGKEITVPFPKEANLPPTASSRGSSTPWIIGCAVAAAVGFVILGLLACGGLALFGFRSQQMQVQEQMMRIEAEQAALEAQASAQAVADEAEKSRMELEKAAEVLEIKPAEAPSPPSPP